MCVGKTLTKCAPPGIAGGENSQVNSLEGKSEGHPVCVLPRHRGRLQHTSDGHAGAESGRFALVLRKQVLSEDHPNVGRLNAGAH